MKKISKRILAVFLVTLLTLAMAMPASAAPVRLNKKSASVTVGKTVKLKVSGTRKKVKWSSSNSKIATVNKKGIVKARKAGNVKIVAKIGKKKLTCKVQVRNVAKNNKKSSNKKKVCQVCNGTGQIYVSNAGICGICGGSAQHYTPYLYHDMIMGWVGGYTMCGGCGGSGHISGYVPCNHCRGTGKI